jgi:hypothetical protein
VAASFPLDWQHAVTNEGVAMKAAKFRNRSLPRFVFGSQTVADRDGADALQAGPQVDSLRAFSVTSMPRWVHRS